MNRDQIRDTGNKSAVDGSGADSQEIRNCECVQSPLEADEAGSAAGISLRVISSFFARFHAPGLSM